MPGVTISAGYGAGGSVVAPLVADSLGYTLLDRAISSTVAMRLQVSIGEAQQGESRRSFAAKFFGALAPVAGVAESGSVEDAAAFREGAEQLIRAALPAGAVVLGRAGAAALAGETDVLRVRLFGPAAARAEQAAAVEGLPLADARRRLPETDSARAHYVRRLYHRDVDDPALYHLQLDSTCLPLPTCAELIVRAYRARVEGAAGYRENPPV